MRRATPNKKAYLCRADRRALLQRPARVEQADRQRALCARQGQAEELQGATRSSASRSRATTSRRWCSAPRLRHRRAACPTWLHAPHDPSAGRGRGAGEVRRELGQGHPGRARGAREGHSSSASSPTPNGARSRRPGPQDRVVGRQAAVPGPGRTRSTSTSARRRCAARASTASRSATSTRRSRPPRA